MIPPTRAPLALLAACLATAAAPQDVEAGRAKAAVCVACHGPAGNSQNPAFPILAGQTARYLYLELKDFKEGRRSDPQMTPFAATLSREDMFDLSAYFAAQKPLLPAFQADPARLARGRDKAREVLCTMCHLGGFKGQNEIPRVAGQHYAYVVKQMKDFKAGRRPNDAGNKERGAETVSGEGSAALAQYLATLD